MRPMRSYWVKRFREQVGMSHTELAERAQISEYEARRLERFSHSYPTHWAFKDVESRLCVALGVRREELEYGPGGYEAHLARQREYWDEAVRILGLDSVNN